MKDTFSDVKMSLLIFCENARNTVKISNELCYNADIKGERFTITFMRTDHEKDPGVPG